MTRRNEEVTFKDILNIFIPKIWLIAAVAVLCSVLMYAYSAFLVDDTYTTSSTMHVRKDTDTINLTDISTADSLIEVIRYRVTSDDFLQDVRANIHENYGNAYLSISLAEIRGAIRYSALGNGMLRVSVTTSNPQLSYAISLALEDYVPAEFFDYLPGAFIVHTYDNAELPSVPNGKGEFKNAIIGFLAGAIISALAVFVYSLLDTRVRNKQKIDDYIDIPLIAAVPDTDKETVYNSEILHGEPSFEILSDNSPSALKESYNSLCTTVMYLPIEDRCKKIAVSSAVYGEGKTSLAINLAISLAKNLVEKKILLIDVDMRCPTVSTFLMGKFDADIDSGLSEYLTEADSMPQVSKIGIENLDIITAGAAIDNPATLVCSEKMKQFVNTVDSEYDYVIFVTPPVNPVSDALLLMSSVNGCILSSKRNYSKISSIDKAKNILNGFGANIYGLVLTNEKTGK